MIINSTSLLEAAPIKGMLPEKIKHLGASHGLAEVGYDIRLKQDIQFWPSTIGSPQHTVSCGGMTHHKQGNFALASAIEEFEMPLDLVGVVHDKSTWARKGLSVFNTVIEPGWKGFLTLELVYHGAEPLHLPAGVGIAQVLFHHITIPVGYEGKYQNQADQPVPAILA